MVLTEIPPPLGIINQENEERESRGEITNSVDSGFFSGSKWDNPQSTTY